MLLIGFESVLKHPQTCQYVSKPHGVDQLNNDMYENNRTAVRHTIDHKDCLVRHLLPQYICRSNIVWVQTQSEDVSVVLLQSSSLLYS